jgi:hypothetical protein
MNTKTNLSRLSLAALFGIAAFGVVSSASIASAGTHSTGNGGAVCKGAGSCLVLELDCKGTYTHATDSNGTVYGHCTQTAQVKPGFKTTVKAAGPKRMRKIGR